MTPNRKPRPNRPPHNSPDYTDAAVEEALRNRGDQGLADTNAAAGRRTKPQAEDLRTGQPFSATNRGGQRDDDILRRTGNFDATTGEVGPDLHPNRQDAESDETEVDEP